MQNYAQPPPSYHRPGSTASFADQPGPLPYAGSQGYQTVTPPMQRQWAPPPSSSSTPVSATPQWAQQPPQQQQGAGGYNPGIYGVMPGGQAQTYTAPVQQDAPPPPPPPKPHQWGLPQVQGPQQGQQVFQNGLGSSAALQNHSTAVSPPPTQTQGPSNYPVPQVTQQQGRPSSVYGAGHPGAYAQNQVSQGQYLYNSMTSPNVQQPTHAAPTHAGHGVQTYGGFHNLPQAAPQMQNTFNNSHGQPMQNQNPQLSGPTGQQHAFSQATAQLCNQQAQQDPNNYGQMQQQGHYNQGPTIQSSNCTQLHHSHVPLQQQPPASSQQHISDNQYPQSPQHQQPQANAWPSAASSASGYSSQSHVQPHQPYSGHQNPQVSNSSIEAPKPLNGYSNATAPGFIDQPSPQSQPVSPVQHRQSFSFASTQDQTGLGRTGSVSSIALGAIHAQRAGNRTSTPKPTPPPAVISPPPRDNASKFSALSTGGPSDWEHFGGGGEEVDDEEYFKKKPVQLDSTEIAPAAQSTSSPTPRLSGVPSPATGPISSGSSQRPHTYQPTPPPLAESQPAYQTSDLGDQAPLQEKPLYQMHNDLQRAYGIYSTSSGPQSDWIQQEPAIGHVQSQQHQHGFTIGDDSSPQHPPLQSGDVQAPENSPPALIPSERGNMTHAVISQQSGHSQLGPGQPPLQHLQSIGSFTVGDSARGAAGATSLTAATQPQTELPSQAHMDQLKAKDDEIQRVKTETNQVMGELRMTLKRLTSDLAIANDNGERSKLDLVTANSKAEDERRRFSEQIEDMKRTAAEVKCSTNAMTKEKQILVERLTEDVEGKEDTIKEKDAAISQLHQQRKELEAKITDIEQRLQAKDSEVESLTQSLEAEKARPLPPPTAASLIQDIDPWYIGSLERFIAMLRNEAQLPDVGDKIAVFTSFLEAESNIRGIPYHKERPASTIQPQPISTTVDLTPHNESSFDYSPGGRPMAKQARSANQSSDLSQMHTTSQESTETAEMTPTSSEDADVVSESTPIHYPADDPTQPQYKAYIPPSLTQEDSAKSLHRQSVAMPSTPTIAPSQEPEGEKGHDEIFFGAHHTDPVSKKLSKQAGNADKAIPSSAVPAPLFSPAATSGQKSVHTPKSAAKQDPLQVLSNILPERLQSSDSNIELDALRSRIAERGLDKSSMQELTMSYDRSAALVRKKNDAERRKRQGASEARADELFNNNEISYADIGVLEEEFKEKERKLKASEDREEYNAYVEAVFNKVFDDLQAQIKDLMELHVQVEDLVHVSVSGIASIQSRSDVPTSEQSMRLFKQLHDRIELRHEHVVLAVAERDKRYKKTEIQPLYAAGKILKMKAVEKHFEKAEKQAAARAQHEKAERVGAFVHIAEEALVAAVAIDQGEIDEILAAVRQLDTADGDEDNALRVALLDRSFATIHALKESSKSLLTIFNGHELALNNAVSDAELAKVRADASPEDVPQGLKHVETERALGEKKLRDELARKIGVLEADWEEIEDLIVEKGGSGGAVGAAVVAGAPSTVTAKGPPSEEEERKKRLQRALEEAKRRNGDL